MKKFCTLFLVMIIAQSGMVTSVLANGKSGNGSGNNNTEGSVTKYTTSDTKDSRNAKKTEDDTSDKTEITSDTSATLKEQENKQENNQKQFKTELNMQKKELQQEKNSLNQQIAELQVQYEALLASGNTTEAAAISDSIKELNKQMDEIQSEIKKTINERYMVVKTMYSDTELDQFNSASDLIAQMYEDADILDAGCVTVNNNIIKFDAPAYIKGGVTLVPLRAISEELGGQVEWDEDTNTVTITKDDNVIKITRNSSTIFVNGSIVEISAPAEVTCGRTYLPLRFLSEALDFNVTWDSENAIIDIDDVNNVDTNEDTTSADTASTEGTSTGTSTN